MSKTVNSLKGKDNGAGSRVMTGEEKEKSLSESVMFARKRKDY